MSDITIEISNNLFQELFECEVDPYSSDEMNGSHHQFSQAMITAKVCENGSFLIDMTSDAFVYLVNEALPAHMEMWYSWGDEWGSQLLNAAKQVLDNHDIPYPY